MFEMFDRREIGLQSLHSCWLPFLNTVITLATFKEFRNTPVLNDKFIRVHNGSEILLFRPFNILAGKLLGPLALFRLKVFNILATSSGVVGDKNNVLVFLFVKKGLKFFLAFGIFLSNFPAIDVKSC